MLGFRGARLLSKERTMRKVKLLVVGVLGVCVGCQSVGRQAPPWKQEVVAEVAANAAPKDGKYDPTVTAKVTVKFSR